MTANTKWPATRRKATAEQMIRHSAGRAVFHQLCGNTFMNRSLALEPDTIESKSATSRWIDYTEAEIADAGVAYLLSAVREHDPKLADQLARGLWARVEDGSWLMEENDDRLQTLGVDWRAHREEARTWAAKRLEREFAPQVEQERELERLRALLRDPVGDAIGAWLIRRREAAANASIARGSARTFRLRIWDVLSDWWVNE